MGLGEVEVGQGGTLAGGHTDPQPQNGHSYPHPKQGSLDSPATQATPAILLETCSLTPALQGALWQRLHCTLAALHTLHTHSLLSPYPTARPPEAQTRLDLLLQTHWALSTFTLRPTLKASDYTPGGTHRPCAPGELSSTRSVARPQDKSRTLRDILRQLLLLHSLPWAGWGLQGSLLPPRLEHMVLSSKHQVRTLPRQPKR